MEMVVKGAKRRILNECIQISSFENYFESIFGKSEKNYLLFNWKNNSSIFVRSVFIFSTLIFRNRIFIIRNMITILFPFALLFLFLYYNLFVFIILPFYYNIYNWIYIFVIISFILLVFVIGFFVAVKFQRNRLKELLFSSGLKYKVFKKSFGKTVFFPIVENDQYYENEF